MEIKIYTARASEKEGDLKGGIGPGKAYLKISLQKSFYKVRGGL